MQNGDAQGRKDLGQILRDEYDLEPDGAVDGEVQAQGTKEHESFVNGEDSKDGVEGLCVDCGDQPASVMCANCEDDFCDVCFSYLHRTGKRRTHEKKRIRLDNEADSLPKGRTQSNEQSELERSISMASSVSDQDGDEGDAAAADDDDELIPGLIVSGGSATFGTWLKERCKYIPLRLTADERQYLRLLDAALNVSEYTDKVDVLVFGSKTKRVVSQLKEMCSILAGLYVAHDFKSANKLFNDTDELAENAEWFQGIFEIGRRYKVLNPDRLRSSYGKLIYMVMDSLIPEVREIMGFDLFSRVQTVFSFLENVDGLSLLDDNLMVIATKEIIAEGKRRPQVQKEIKQKEAAIEQLSRKYQSLDLTKESIRQCLYSIGDNHAYLRSNRDPVEKMLKYLNTYFDSGTVDSDFNLSISSGRSGARLSHSHEKQFFYVNQSLSLWSIILNDMFKMWYLADEDLLANKSRYRLLDVGQGLARVQAAPNVGRSMHKIISQAQQKAKRWIGSSVVHLGDHNVPNAYYFIDKYLQVPRILNPLVLVLEELEHVARDPFIAAYLADAFGGVEAVKKTILSDFFKHGFDGSGADNFYDAGSCIDGRLTSAWEWTNNLPRKPYFKVFLLCGFRGFDGFGAQ